MIAVLAGPKSGRETLDVNTSAQLSAASAANEHC
jgi:hypothetical protein